MTHIYESPDGGETIYKREIGSNDRILHRVSSKKQQLQESQDRWIMWQDILHASNSNPALREAIERAQVIYQLSKHD
jgi:hypothetical protein